jgi:Caspase domain
MASLGFADGHEYKGRLMTRMFCQVWLGFVLLMAAMPVEAKRVALVIANARYANAGNLKNPPSDAQLVAQSLRRAGFDQVDVKIDLGKTAMEQALRSFGEKSEGADVALVYYAGHGIEAGGQNYLIPTDARLVRDRDLEVEATRLDTAMLMTESARLRIVVLDACRNNPFMASMQRTMRNRAVGRGLAAVEPEGETLVVYAAKAGATAADGEGANSPFAQALAKRLVQPGLEISLLFRSVRDDVLQSTGRVQEPFTYGSLSGNAFYFVPPTNVAVVNNGPITTQQQAVTNVSAQTSEALYWQGTLSANSEGGFRDYLKRYPKGEYAAVARANLDRFIQPKPRPEPGPTPRPTPNLVTTQQSGGSSQVGGISFGSLVNAFSKANAQSNAVSGGSAVQRFAFTPNQLARRQTRAQFVSGVASDNAVMKTMLDLVMPANSPFSLIEGEFSSKYGMSVNNLADSFAILIETMRAVSKQDDSEGTRAQAQGLRNQIAGFLANDPSITSLSPQSRQQTSDTALMLGVFVQAGYELAKAGGAAQKTAYADAIAQMAQQSFGFDVRLLRLTNNGLEL